MDAVKTEYTKILKDLLNLRNEFDEYKLEKEKDYKKILLSVINVIDIFEMADEIIKERNWNNSDNSGKIINRYATVLKALNKILAERGITKLEFPENRLIVGYCKVVDVQPDSGKLDNSIISVIKDGYIHGKELIREAEVIIVKN